MTIEIRKCRGYFRSGKRLLDLIPGRKSQIRSRRANKIISQNDLASFQRLANANLRILPAKQLLDLIRIAKHAANFANFLPSKLLITHFFMKEKLDNENGALPEAEEQFEWFDSLGAEGFLLCPDCGFEYNHIVGFGLEYYPHDYDAPKVEKLYFNASFVMHSLEAARCAALRVDVMCENGHAWRLFLSQDHGNLYLQTDCPRR